MKKTLIFILALMLLPFISATCTTTLELIDRYNYKYENQNIVLEVKNEI